MNLKSALPSVVLACAIALSSTSFAGDLRIPLPKSSKPTPVQSLNQQGVKAVRKGDLEKAEKLFYKAYLIDPDDPYTLNNLGYISELKGNAERAEKYYELATRQGSDSLVETASLDKVKGHSLKEVTQNYATLDLRVNRGNIHAMSLLSQGRTAEADEALRQTLAYDPKNPFTLNNLGYTMEAEGDLGAAYRFYAQSADTHSSEKIVVAEDKQWRGKPISEVAARNAQAVRERIDTEQSTEAGAARLNLQGVSALNRNDVPAARDYFQEAYKLDPHNAFSLNNMGYVFEMNGDEETAQELYDEAAQADISGARVTLASHREMVGMRLGEVANANSSSSESDLNAARQVRQRQQQNAPIVLKRRDGSTIPEPQVVPRQQGSPQQGPPPEGTSVPQGPPSQQ
jgi:Flp pilus assembly protein TadD